MVSMVSKVPTALPELEATTTQHLITHRRELHASPELSFKEDETARYIAERLNALRVDKLTQGVGGTGVVAQIPGQRPGRSALVGRGKDGPALSETAERSLPSPPAGLITCPCQQRPMAAAL